MREPSSMTVIGLGGVRAALEAHKALGTGGDVLLMDDVLDPAHEVALKSRAARLGRVLLGPGAGFARLGGHDLGFAASVAAGPVGIVSASGSAARELAVLLDRAGVGVAHSAVTGPRDLTDEVAASGALAALERMRRDPQVRVLALIPWPGDADPADRLVSLAATPDHPVVVCALGREVVVPPGVTVVDTLDAAALAVARILGRAPAVSSPSRPRWVSGGLVRGLYCGGGLCAEAAVVLGERLERVACNVPVAGAMPLPEEGDPRVHSCIDLGAPEVRRGGPHPMADGTARAAAISGMVGDPRVRVLLLDVVLGSGAPADPAGDLAAPLTDLLRTRPQVSVLAHVVGTDRDPQGLGEQERRLSELGVRVLASNAAAARLAAALVS